MISELDLLNDTARALQVPVESLPANLTDHQIEKSFDLADGTVPVKRSRGDWPIPSYKVGRSRRTPLSAIIAFKLKQLNSEVSK